MPFCVEVATLPLTKIHEAKKVTSFSKSQSVHTLVNSFLL